MTQSELIDSKVESLSGTENKPELLDKPAPINIVMVQDVFQVGDIKGNADKIINLSIAASQQGARQL